ncbi:MAG: polysaccharide deacetylase family protein [Calditrichota bacterium]
MKALAGNKLKLTVVGLLLVAAGWILEANAESQTLLIRPEATWLYLHNDYQSPIVKTWVDFWLRWLGASGVKVEVRGEDGLLEDINYFNLIVLPGTLCLDEKHILALREFLSCNGGLLMTWATGCRSLNGDWKGYDFLTELMGAPPVEAEDLNAGQLVSLQFRYGSPGTLNTPPGLRLRLFLTHKPCYLPQTAFVQVGGYWSDPTFIDTKLPAASPEAGFITQQTLLGGRIAWFGANLDGMSPDSSNAQGFLNVLKELIPWLKGESACGIAPWPEGKQAAALIHGDIEDQFAGAVNIVSAFSKYRIPNTYNLLVNEAAKYPQLIDRMIKSGAEIGIHGDNHAVFQGQDFDTQVRRLKAALDFIETYTKRPQGFRPPELAYDETTLRALDHLGLRYLTADDTPDRNYPHWTPLQDESFPEKGIVLFPKSELDDWDLFGRFNLTDPVRMADIMLSDYNHALDLGGLYKFNYHSQFLAKPQFAEVADQVISKIKADESKVWCANAADISYWVRQRERLTFSYTASDNALEVCVTNNNPDPAKQVTFCAYPPLGIGAGNFAPTATSRNCRYDSREDVVLLYLPELRAGEQFTAKFESHTGHPLDAQSKSWFMKFIYGVLGLAAVFLTAIAYYLLFTRSRKVGVTSESGENNEPEPGIIQKAPAKPTEKTKPVPKPVASESESVEFLAKRLAEAVKTIQDIAEDPLLIKHPDLRQSVLGIAARAGSTASETKPPAPPRPPLMKPFDPRPPANNTRNVSFMGSSASSNKTDTALLPDSPSEPVVLAKRQLKRPPPVSSRRGRGSVQPQKPLPPLKKIVPNASDKSEMTTPQRNNQPVLSSGSASSHKGGIAPSSKPFVGGAAAASGLRSTAPLPRSPRDKIKSDTSANIKGHRYVQETKSNGLTMNTTASLPKPNNPRESRASSTVRSGRSRDLDADKSESETSMKNTARADFRNDFPEPYETAEPVINPTMRSSVSVFKRKASALNS